MANSTFVLFSLALQCSTPICFGCFCHFSLVFRTKPWFVWEHSSRLPLTWPVCSLQEMSSHVPGFDGYFSNYSTLFYSGRGEYCKGKTVIWSGWENLDDCTMHLSNVHNLIFSDQGSWCRCNKQKMLFTTKLHCNCTSTLQPLLPRNCSPSWDRLLTQWCVHSC